MIFSLISDNRIKDEDVQQIIQTINYQRQLCPITKPFLLLFLVEGNDFQTNCITELTDIKSFPKKTSGILSNKHKTVKSRSFSESRVS